MSMSHTHSFWLLHISSSINHLNPWASPVYWSWGMSRERQEQAASRQKSESFAFLSQAEPKEHFHTFFSICPHFRKLSLVSTHFAVHCLLPPQPGCWNSFFQDLVDSESLLATQQAGSDKKTEVFSQQLLSGNNVSNKMKLALHSWKIYYNSPYAYRSNVNTNQLHSHRL